MSWNDLSLQEKSDFIKLAVKNGMSNMKDIRHIYSSGGKLSLPFKKGVDNLKYNTFKGTLPNNLRNTPESEYRMHKLWEYNGKPNNFNTALINNVFTLQDDGFHAPSVSENPRTGIIEFLKPKNHPTVNMELDWYNSPEAKDFRKQYKLDTTSNPYRYVPRGLEKK